MHKPGGAEHARWVFDYDDTAEEDDEAGYRFGTRLPPGEYVSIRDEDGEHAHLPGGLGRAGDLKARASFDADARSAIPSIRLLTPSRRGRMIPPQ